MTRKMPLDFARCDGSVYVAGERQVCERRSSCLRHTCITPDAKSVVRIFISLADGETCLSYVEDGE